METNLGLHIFGHIFRTNSGVSGFNSLKIQNKEYAQTRQKVISLRERQGKN